MVDDVIAIHPALRNSDDGYFLGVMVLIGSF